MPGVEIRQRAASEGQRGGRRGQEGKPPLYIGLAEALSTYACTFACNLPLICNRGKMTIEVISRSIFRKIMWPNSDSNLSLGSAVRCTILRPEKKYTCFRWPCQPYPMAVGLFVFFPILPILRHVLNPDSFVPFR